MRNSLFLRTFTCSLLALSAVACGTAEAELEKEQKARRSADSENEALRTKLATLNQGLKYVSTGAGTVWTWIRSDSNYQDSLLACEQIGFELPDRAQIDALLKDDPDSPAAAFARFLDEEQYGELLKTKLHIRDETRNLEMGGAYCRKAIAQKADSE